MFKFLKGLGADRWKAYGSHKERFSAAFPGHVSRQFFGFLEDDGESPGSVVYSSKSGDGVLYEVRVTRVMEYYGSAEDFLKTALVTMASSMTDCVIVRQKSEVFRDRPAIAFEASIRGAMSLCGVAALRDRTLYMLSVFFRSGAQHNLPRFLNGFEMLR